MLGVGGVLAEAIADVTFRLAPIERVDADEMIDELRAQALLGPIRGEPAVDRERLADVLLGLSRVAVEDPDGRVDRPQPADRRRRGADRRRRARRGGSLSSPVDAAHFRALFDPRGVIVAGASAHPGKFGFVALHNILRCGYAGTVFATNLEGGSVLGIDTVRSVEEVPAGAADLVFVCTPAAANVALLKACAARGVRAAFVTSAGYGEAGSGRRGRAARARRSSRTSSASCWRGRTARASSRRPRACARRSSVPTRPPGRIGLASQSGNLVSALDEHVGAERRRHQPGDLGGQRCDGFGRGLPRLVRRRRPDVGRPRVRRRHRGRPRLLRAHRARSRRRKPVVLVKGGATAGGQRAAASHTGALATDDRVFEGVCRQAGVTRALGIEEAFEAAATFATQPLPRGPEHRGRDDRWRLGRHHRGRDRAQRASARAARRRPAGRDRREAPAALEPQQPGRPRRRRDARHDPRRARAGRAASVDRRGGVPRPRHPVERGEAHEDGRVLPRPRPRADRRLPRAAGRALRARRPPRSRPRPASRCSRRPSSRSRRPTTPDLQPCGPAGSSATRARIEPSAPSSTCGGTRATGTRTHEDVRARARARAAGDPRGRGRRCRVGASRRWRERSGCRGVGPHDASRDARAVRRVVWSTSSRSLWARLASLRPCSPSPHR